MKVYLDNCAYNRPFDDQRAIIVNIETRAKLVVQQMIKDAELELLWSDVLDYENNDNPFEERRFKIAEWKIYKMLTDTILKRKGLDVLSEAFGLVDAERFISLVLREPFDYTEWQRDLYKDVSLDDFCHNVKKFTERKE